MDIFVSNIPYRVHEKDLQELFEGFGTVDSCKIVVDRETGKSKGFGFVTMKQHEGSKAIEALNGYELEGRKIVVQVSVPKKKGRERH